jgi:hypothetical protein
MEEAAKTLIGNTKSVKEKTAATRKILVAVHVAARLETSW